MRDPEYISETVSPAEFVIGKMGGLTALARAMGKPVTTVQGWKDRGTIPQTHWKAILSLAAKAAVALEYADFVNTHPAPEAEQVRS